VFLVIPLSLRYMFDQGQGQRWRSSTRKCRNRFSAVTPSPMVPFSWCTDGKVPGAGTLVVPRTADFLVFLFSIYYSLNIFIWKKNCLSLNCDVCRFTMPTSGKTRRWGHNVVSLSVRSFVLPSVRPFVAELVNFVIFWKRMNRLWRQSA